MAGPSVLPKRIRTLRPLRSGSFEAQSRGLRARCLRFAAGVAHGSRKTRFRLLARLYRAGFHPRGSLARFQ
jgi:hypothetical protein